jgi:hypothetical protein
MSTNVGTLQAPRAGGSILLAGFLALLVMLTIAVVAISINQGEQAETTQVGRSLVYGPVGGSEQTFGSRGDPAAVRQQYGIVGGTAANTPSELNPVYMHGRNLQGLSPLEPVYMHGRNLQGLSPLSDALGTTTPTERSGGIIGGLPAKFYDRHQRG